MSLHVETAGSGPDLVLVHGWAMHGGIFAALAGRLAERYTVHRVDLPGHGHSRDSTLPLEPPGCAAALLERLPPATWLGWSLGGLVALHAALARPARVPALVLLATNPCFVAGPDAPHGVDRAVFRQFGAGLADDHRATVDRFLALEAQGSARMREDLRELRAQVHARGTPTPAALREGLAALERTDLRARLPSLAMPALWIGGRRDRLVPWQALEAAAAACADGRFVAIEDAGHAPFLREPDAVADAVFALAEARTA